MSNVTTSWLDSQPKDKIDAALESFRANESLYNDYLKWCNGDERFALWMLLVDRRIMRRVGVTSRDLSDFNSWDCYEAGYSPAEAAEECLEGDDTYQMFFGGE